jgi:hypothetical protein
MWFYHEGYFDAYYAAAVLEDLRSRDRHEDGPAHEPAERPIPLRWVMTWFGGLSAICLGLGLAAQWLLQ